MTDRTIIGKLGASPEPTTDRPNADTMSTSGIRRTNPFIDAVTMPIVEDEERSDLQAEDSTDLTDPGNVSTDTLFSITVSDYQARDVGDATAPPPPGSGEYYGALHYISSVEIKTMVLSLLLGEFGLTNPDDATIEYTSSGNDETLALCVLFCIDQFKQLTQESKQIKNLYFDFPLCSALSTQRRLELAEQLDKIILEECRYAEKPCPKSD
jgi:hypothetical protein